MINILTKFLVFFMIAIPSFSIYENEINQLFNFDDTEQDKNIIIEQELPVETIDPILLKDTYSARAMRYIYAQLFKLDDSGLPQPYLLSTFRYNDEMEIYCKLRDDIYFSNGDPITSEDVRNSLNEFLTEGVINLLYKSIKIIKIINDKEFLIILNYPDNTLEIALSHPLSSIFKRVDKKIMTSGKYAIDKISKNRLKLKKNPYYFDKDSSADSLEILGDLNSYQRVVNTLNLPNYHTYDLYKEDIDTARKMGSLKNSDIITDNIFDIISLIFGNKNSYSLEDKKAIESLLTREANTFYPRSMMKSELSVLEKKYSREEAIKLLKKSGALNKRVTIMCLNTIHNRNYIQYVAYDLMQSGIKVDIEIYNSDKFLSKLRTKDYDIALYNVTINKLYPVTSLEKIAVVEIANPELEDALLPFINIFGEGETEEAKNRMVDKLFYLVYSGRYIIPIAHRQTYILSHK